MTYLENNGLIEFCKKETEVNDFISGLEQFYINLSTNDLNDKKGLAVRTFNEFLLRLNKRASELLYFENLIFDQPKLELEKMTLKEIQMYFVDKTEGFHQHVYSVISAFAMLLNHIAPREFCQRIPIRKNGKFLKFLKNEYPKLIDFIKILELSTSFRNKFIDHTQQHVLHDWMTYSYPENNQAKAVVIYFIKNSNNVYQREERNPFSLNFQPPINCKEHYISPYYKDVYKSLLVIVEYIITEMGEAIKNQLPLKTPPTA